MLAEAENENDFCTSGSAFTIGHRICFSGEAVYLVPPVPYSSVGKFIFIAAAGGTVKDDKSGSEAVSFGFNLGANIGVASVGASISVDPADSADTVDHGFLNFDFGDDKHFPGLKKPTNYAFQLRTNYYWRSVSCGVEGGSAEPEGNVGVALFTWPDGGFGNLHFVIHDRVYAHANPDF